MKNSKLHFYDSQKMWLCVFTEMEKILVGVDFSSATDVVVSAAAQMAKAFGAELHLLHVIEPEPTYTAYGFAPGEFPVMHSLQGETRKRAQKTLDEVVEKANGLGVMATGHLGDGSPLHCLQDKAKELDVNLVVLGTHGHGVVASILLGSVADGMVRKALYPTLVIPARGKK